MTYIHFTDADHLRQQTVKITRVLAEAMFMRYRKVQDIDSYTTRVFSVACTKKDDPSWMASDPDTTIRSICFLAALQVMTPFCQEHAEHIDLIGEEMQFLLAQDNFFHKVSRELLPRRADRAEQNRGRIKTTIQ